MTSHTEKTNSAPDELVSVIVPCFNYGSLLTETVASLRNQTYAHWEALIVDDGSTDHTAEVARQLASEDGRVRYIHQKNQGLPGARNTGLRHARGNYIQFLDSDDLLSREKLELQVAYMQSHPEVDISYTGCHYFNSEAPEVRFPDHGMRGTDWMPRISGRGNRAVEALVERDIMPVNSPLVRASILKKVDSFDRGMKSLEDWDFWMKCALAGYSFQFFDHPDAYALIRVHGASMTQDQFKMLVYELKMRERIDKHLRARRAPESGSAKPDAAREMNRSRATEICKILFRKTSAGDLKRLRPLLKTLGPKKFMRHYFSALNHKRKNVPL